MKMLGKQVYRFDGVEVDPSQGCLRRNGEELSVRQKSLQALLYLLEQRHRLVTKEELIERVWQGMAVSDDALVQLIKEIRQSLGDDPRQPRFIKTVPKAGYRFIAPVEEFHLELPAALEIERHSSVEIEYEEEITGDTLSRSDAEKRRWGFIPGLSVSPRRRGVLLTAIAAILLLAGATATYLLARSSRRSMLAEVTLPLLPNKKPLAVMYFNNQSGSAELDWLREGLADMLITNLSRSKRLNVLSRQQLFLLIERSGHSQTEAIRLDDAMEMARKTRAEAIVLGSFVRLGEKIRIDVQLYNAQNGQPIKLESIVADKPDDILYQIDLLSLKLADHLGASPDEREDRPVLTGVMTNNLDAYRYYSLGLEQVQMFQFPEAIERFEKATQLDPQFAMAYARIGYIYAVRWTPKVKAKPYLEKAFQMSARLTEKDRLYITAWNASASSDSPTAIETYQRMIAQYPMEVEGYQRLCWLLLGQGRIDEALITTKQGLIIDPESKDLYNGLGSVYSILNKYEEAVAAYQHYVQLAPADPNALDSLGTCHQAFGHYDLARDAYQRAISINPESRVAVIHLGNAYLQEGRYRAALEQYQRHLQIARDDTGRARSYDYIAQLYLKWGDLNKAETAARQAARYTKEFSWAPILVAMARGDRQTAEKLRREVSAKLPYVNYSYGGNLGFRHSIVGYLALKAGRTAEAIEYFKEAQRLHKPYWNVDPFEDRLANAYLELGRLDEAIAEYERILRLNPNYPLAHYHLAQAFERKGQPEQSRAAYERFLQVWKDADADVPEVIRARKAVAETGS